MSSYLTGISLGFSLFIPSQKMMMYVISKDFFSSINPMVLSKRNMGTTGAEARKKLRTSNHCILD